jgi:electron transfer flavoprotein alpha subunit
MGSGVLCIAESAGNELKKSAFELAGVGRRLADALGGPLTGALVGRGVSGLVGGLGRRGLPKVYLVDDAALGRYTSDGYSLALQAVVRAADPAVILLASSAMGKDLGPALAARLSCGIISDAIGLDVVAGKVHATRPVYAGKAQIEVEPVQLPVIVSVRPNIYEPAPEGDGAAESVAVTADFTGEQIRAVVKELLEPEQRRIDLTEADIIVSGGRGLKGPEHFHLIEELAAALGGVVGASRAVVDAGWRPHSEQVGQTGKTVSPKLYVACGISGAIQHLAGMSSSKCIVAVNKDPEAPVFKVADYGIVGDVFEVLPALTKAIREKKGL